MVFALYLGFYAFGLLLARWHTTASGAIRAGLAVSIAAVLSGLTVAGLLSREMLGALLFGAFLGVISLPVLMLGLGLLAGAAIKHTIRKGGWRWRGACLTTAIVPIAIGIVAGLGIWNNLQSAKALRAAQTATVDGDLGVFPLSLPLAPHLQVQWLCEAHSPCRADLDRSEDGLRGASNPAFLRIGFVPVHSTCDGPDAPLNDCTTQETLRDWCALRPDYASTALCSGTPKHALFFWEPEQSYHPAHNLEDYAQAAQTTLEDEEHTILCNVTRDSIRRTSDLSRLCGVNWEIAPGVMAGVRLDKFDDEALIDEALAMMRIAIGYWRTLQR